MRTVPTRPVKLEFHDTDTDTNILARILADTRDFLKLFLWQVQRHANILATIIARMSARNGGSPCRCRGMPALCSAIFDVLTVLYSKNGPIQSTTAQREMINGIFPQIIPAATNLFEPVLPIFSINVLTDYTRRCFRGK